jgi:prepilin-type N-terminal cleavage/methylation domain-containing protein
MRLKKLKLKKKSASGFTLIEVLLYLALFSIIMGGVLISVLNMVEGVGRTRGLIEIQQEGAFIQSKISWALTGAQIVSDPPIGTPGSTLSLTKFDSTTANLSLNGTDVVIDTGSGPFVLNNSRVDVTALNFTRTVSVSGVEEVDADFTLSILTDQGKTLTQDFSLSRFLRK